MLCKKKENLFSLPIRLVALVLTASLLVVAAANAETTYRYDRTIELPTVGPTWTTGTPTSGYGAKGLHFSNGLLYVAQYAAEIVQVVDPGSDAIVRTIQNTQVASNGTKSDIVDVWADVDGNVWAVADGATTPKMLYADADDTSFSELFTLTTRAFTVDRDAAGNFFCATPGGPATMYDSAGNLVKTFSYNPYSAMGVNADGTTLYLGGRNSSGSELDKTLYSVDVADGSYDILSASHGNVAEPIGLQLDETNGNVFLSIRRTSATGDNCVIKYDLEGNELLRWNQWDPETGEVSYDILNGGINDNGMDQVYGVTVDETTGTVYVARHKLYAADEGVSRAHVMVFAIVPEPGVLAILAAGLCFLIFSLGSSFRQR